MASVNPTDLCGTVWMLRWTRKTTQESSTLFTTRGEIREKLEVGRRPWGLGYAYD